MAHQRYTDPTAQARMAAGNCPECGRPPDEHTGGLGPCSLTDNGAAGRIYQYQQDETERLVEQSEPATTAIKAAGDRAGNPEPRLDLALRCQETVTMQGQQLQCDLTAAGHEGRPHSNEAEGVSWAGHRTVAWRRGQGQPGGPTFGWDCLDCPSTAADLADETAAARGAGWHALHPHGVQAEPDGWILARQLTPDEPRLESDWDGEVYASEEQGRAELQACHEAGHTEYRLYELRLVEPQNREAPGDGD